MFPFPWRPSDSHFLWKRNSSFSQALGDPDMYSNSLPPSCVSMCSGSLCTVPQNTLRLPPPWGQQEVLLRERVNSITVGGRVYRPKFSFTCRCFRPEFMMIPVYPQWMATLDSSWPNDDDYLCWRA